MTLNQIIEYAKVNNIPFDEELTIAVNYYNDRTQDMEQKIGMFRDIALTTNKILDAQSNPKIVLIDSDVCLYDNGYSKLKKQSVHDFVNQGTFEQDLRGLRKSPVHSMRMEFVYWIIDSIRDRLSWCNYPKMTDAMYEDLVKVCQSYTNKDYEECSNELTNALEKCLIQHGIKENDAIRMSWKWSD